MATILKQRPALPLLVLSGVRIQLRVLYVGRTDVVYVIQGFAEPSKCDSD